MLSFSGGLPAPAESVNFFACLRITASYVYNIGFFLVRWALKVVFGYSSDLACASGFDAVYSHLSYIVRSAITVVIMQCSIML